MARELRQVVRQMPARTGLVTAGQQSSIAEDALWRATNATARFDGLIERRPGLSQRGQTLKVANDAVSTPVNMRFRDLADWQIDDSAAGGKISTSVNNNVLGLAVLPGAGTEVLSYGRSLQSTEVQPTSAVWSVRFGAKGTNLVNYNGADTVPRALVIRGIAAAGSGREFALFQSGIYYKNASDDKYTLVATSVSGDEQWHQYEILVDTAGNTTVTIDDVLAGTIASSSIKSVTPGSDLFELEWRSDTANSYYWEISDVTYAATVSTPFSSNAVAAVSYLARRTGSGSRQDIPLAFSSKRVWQERGARGHWVSLLELPEERMFFGRYREEMIFVNSHPTVNASSIYRWDGSNDAPVQLEGAPPMAFAVEHLGRLWAAGDKKHPMRVYFSANRQPDVWFFPDSGTDNVDAVLEAGFIDIKSDGGDEVTAIYGDFYGRMLIFTRRSVWQLQGDGFDTFSVTAINRSTGCQGPNAVTQVGNDLMFASREGVHSLQATQQFGDLQTSFVSSTIQDVWTDSPALGFRLRDPKLLETNVRYLPLDNLMYVTLHRLQDTISEVTYVFNTATKEWFGPWEVSSASLALLEFSNKPEQLMLHGQGAGVVMQTNRQDKSDASVDYEMILESARINGRSIDGSLAAQVKRWKTLRLYVMPRGDWNFTVEWQTDSGAISSGGPDNIQSQNFYKSDVLSKNFRLGKSRWGSDQTIAPIEIPIDTRGRWVRFIIKQSGASQDFVLQGWELEFVPARPEKE